LLLVLNGSSANGVCVLRGAVGALVLCLFIMEFSYTDAFAENVYFVLMILLVTKIVMETILGNVLKDEALTPPIAAYFDIIKMVITLGTLHTENALNSITQRTCSFNLIV
jgi:hypothetical protein